MNFTEFLKLVGTIRMLYGTELAENFFAKNVDLYYNLNHHELLRTESE